MKDYIPKNVFKHIEKRNINEKISEVIQKKFWFTISKYTKRF